MVDPWMLCGNGWGLSGRYHGWPCQGLTNMTCAECWSSHWKPPRTRHRATENLKVVESIITTVVIHTRCYKHQSRHCKHHPECGMSSSPLISTAASHYTTLRQQQHHQQHHLGISRSHHHRDHHLQPTMSLVSLNGIISAQLPISYQACQHVFAMVVDMIDNDNIARHSQHGTLNDPLRPMPTW